MKISFPTSSALMVAVLAGTLATVRSAEDSIVLKQSFPLGKKLHQSTVIDQTMKMGGLQGAPAGQGVNMKNKITVDMSMDIRKHGDEGKKAIVTYEKLGMTIDAAGFKQEFDSGAEDGNPFTALAGKQMVVIYDKEDEIQSIEGLDALAKDGEGGGIGGGALGAMFSDDRLKEMIRGSLLQGLPEGPVKIGDSWPYSVETPMPQGMGSLTVNGEYTLKRFEEVDGNRCAVIAMKGKLESEGKTKMEMQGQEVEMEIGESTFEGDIYFDNALGLPRKSTVLTTMKMTMGVLGQTMDMDMIMTMINKLTKVEEGGE